MKKSNYVFEHSNSISLESKISKSVLIRIPLDTEGYWQKEYDQNTLTSQIIQDFKSENTIDMPDDYFLDFSFQNKTLKTDEPISYLLAYQIPIIYINQLIKKKPLKFIHSTCTPYNFVGRPFPSPFEVFLYSSNDKSLTIQTYDADTINDLFLNEFCNSSAYCNGNNHLFISGGERPNGELIDNFWEIDLSEQIIAEPTKIIPKKNHSMIFIPDKYVFIVGGNDQKCFYFNTETAEVEDWANLNKLRLNPALILIKQNLYCFDNSNNKNNEQFTVEKTDLDSLKPEWILLKPKIDVNSGNAIRLNQENFGVAKDNEDNIIFIGGNMSDKNIKFNYKYNVKENKIEMTNIPFTEVNLKEKTFLPCKKNIDFILPGFDKENPKIVFYSKNKNKVEVFDYQLKQSQNKSLVSDFKYDFNMPKVSISEQDNINNIYNSNSNRNNDINIHIKENENIDNNINFNINNINNNINNNIDNNIDNNINIAQNENLNSNVIVIDNNLKQLNLKEIQIDQPKENLELNIENKPTNINKNAENELNIILMETDKNLDDKNKNSNININTPINLDIIDKDNDKDINIKGTSLGNKSININGNINPNINLKDHEIKIQNDIKENKSQINNISTDINNIDKKIKTNINNTFQKSIKEPNDNNINLIPDYNLNGNIPGTKKVIHINSNNNSNKNNKKNLNTNNKSHNKNQPKEFFKLSGIIPGTKEKSKNVKDKNINNTNNNTKETNKKIEVTQGIKSNSNSSGNEKKLSIPKLDLEGKIPEFNINNNNINIKPHMINLKGNSKDNIQSYEVNRFSPSFNINANNHKNDINNNELLGENNIYSFNNGKEQGSKMDMSSFDNNNFKEIRFEQKNLGVTKINLIDNEENNKNNNNNNNIDDINLKPNYNNNEQITISGVTPGNLANNNNYIFKSNPVNNSLINNNKPKINLSSSYNNANIIQNGNNGNENNINNNNIYFSSQIPYTNNNIINKQNTKTKIKNLPLVGVKNDTFVSSKVEPINSLDVENFDVKKLKSTNVGINGIKLGERIDN